jgi:hypothetical protein
MSFIGANTIEYVDNQGIFFGEMLDDAKARKEKGSDIILLPAGNA